MTMRRSLTMAVLAGALPLAGCISFGGKPPKALMTLQATAQPEPGRQQSSAGARSIVIEVPVTPAAIAGTRVPVQENATEIAYVKDVQWSEPPARLFARLLSDTLTARANLVVLSPAQSFQDPSSVLSGELRSFGIDATAREAVVIYDASLVRAGQTSVEKRRFEARTPVAVIDPLHIGPALQTAANKVAGDVAAWVGK